MSARPLLYCIYGLGQNTVGPVSMHTTCRREVYKLVKRRQPRHLRLMPYPTVMIYTAQRLQVCLSAVGQHHMKPRRLVSGACASLVSSSSVCGWTTRLWVRSSVR